MKKLVLLVSLIGLTAGKVQAGDIDEGLAAARQGDFTKAGALFQPLAEKGDAVAQVYFGQLYYYGSGRPRDYGTAFGWYLKAANQGNSRAENFLGDMYTDGNGVQKDYGKALQWYGKAAEQGNMYAQFSLATMYEEGRGVERSYSTAATWYQKAAVQGDAAAENNLGRLYQDGLGVAKDYGHAVQLFRQSAEQGLAEAESNLGSAYQRGAGVPQDYAQAAEWHTKAAAQGWAKSQSLLGDLYYRGNGVPQDYAKAASLYLKAAEHGDVLAQTSLGFLYAMGKGVHQDYVVTYALFKLPGEHHVSKEHWDLLLSKLSKPQLEAGDALVGEMQRVGVEEALERYAPVAVSAPGTGSPPTPALISASTAPVTAPASLIHNAPAQPPLPLDPQKPMMAIGYADNPYVIPWPRDANGQLLTGKTVLLILVSKEGLPVRIDISTSSGYRALDAAAIEGGKRLRFNPARRDGTPVEGYVRFPVDMER